MRPMTAKLYFPGVWIKADVSLWKGHISKIGDIHDIAIFSWLIWSHQCFS